ncbi:uracil-DNA glycosylase [Burkholderia ubonensis]|uniref:uracil-DNA glycosylase n=1 Tax=Burkholderia ubonensis TaxID=101571 RepID=UPI000F57A89A|nr:uracil-DNA glycosylase [Burkholderia ubonensis]RQP37047.1 uracil-DNA glycosylase [Burkholderia ubonensis]RQP43386.1 uracil-DNA glycosylase [Burkholderia ubonensis]RQP46170.1 uracil-DNA glycosylase [Burkholderia ubonensis]RQP59501.1 uracil-DNA glycosylase [Burkholderia ubonensis]RQP65562.1 uracil-DNA glycosylase [Burkholderia ubonensis]
MAWAEAALEEMGLAQIWVRRGLRAADAPAAAAQDAVTKAPEAAPVGQAGEGGAARAGAIASEPAASVAVTPAVDVPTRPLPAYARADAPKQASDAGAAPAATQPPEAHALSAAGERIASRQAVRTDDVAPPAEARPVEEDDFAWFDAAPPADPAPVAELRVAETPVAELDWDALAARVADCTRCRLCEKRTNTVFGVGDREADWMLIGEAPGENEDKQGEPFVGQAGKLLDNMLQSLSLERGANVYIANVIKCRPPGNRNPEPDEVARCEPYLQRQVALVKPKLIVALGRFAAQTLLKTDASIASLRGRVHTYEGVPVIVTYHPAYLLRSLQDKSKAWADLCLARDTFRGAAIPGAGERSAQ